MASVERSLVPSVTIDVAGALVAYPPPAAAAPSATPAPATRGALPAPLMPLVVVALVSLAVSVAAWQGRSGIGVMSWVTTVLWTLPTVQTLIGLSGVVRVRRRLRESAAAPDPGRVTTDSLVVVVPTIGRADTVAALERVVPTFWRQLPVYFPGLRVDVVVEEGCEAADRIARLVARHPATRMVVVPASYSPPRGTRFKARANHYAHEMRKAAGEDRDDVWVLHMDDDTAVGPDTAREIARFVTEQRRRPAAERLHLAQGVLTYPRENATHYGMWLADSVRPGSDLSLFVATTGAGTPRAGLHGELLLVRGSVEARIGWDFGPRAIVEDAEFGLHVTRRHPGRSGWFPGRSFGATPSSLADLVRQRERWAWGLLELAARPDLPWTSRLLLAHNVAIWAMGPLQHIAVVLAAGVLLGDLDTLPATAVLLPLWALTIGYQVWNYWVGYLVNVRAGAQRRPWAERWLVVLLIPLFSLWEAAGVLRGVVRFVRGGESVFTVIAKPR